MRIGARLGTSRRGSWRHGLVACAVVVLGACGDLVGPDPALEASAPGPEAVALMSMMNAHRASVGCGPLAWHAPAAEVARLHSEDMASRGYFDHVDPEGGTLADRLRRAGISYRYAGENIAAGQRTVEEVFAAWLDSGPHRASIETCEFTHHGLGREARYWTLVMLQPR